MPSYYSRKESFCCMKSENYALTFKFFIPCSVPASKRKEQFLFIFLVEAYSFRRYLLQNVSSSLVLDMILFMDSEPEPLVKIGFLYKFQYLNSG
jgi:hypothetical protein